MNRTDYMFYIIDMMTLALVLTLSIIDIYTMGVSQWYYSIPQLLLALTFKYVYLAWYVITKLI